MSILAMGQGESMVSRTVTRSNVWKGLNEIGLCRQRDEEGIVERREGGRGGRGEREGGRKGEREKGGRIP